MIIIPNKQRFLRNVYNIRWMGLIIETTLKSAQACFILPWLVSSIWLKTMVSVSPRPNLRSDQCLAAIIFYRLPQLAPAGEWMPRPGQPTLLQSCKASEHGWQVWQEGRESLWAAKRQKLVEMARLFHSNSIYCYFFCTQHSQAEHYEWQALNDAQLQEDSLQYRFEEYQSQVFDIDDSWRWADTQAWYPPQKMLQWKYYFSGVYKTSCLLRWCIHQRKSLRPAQPKWPTCGLGNRFNFFLPLGGVSDPKRKSEPRLWGGHTLHSNLGCCRVGIARKGNNWYLPSAYFVILSKLVQVAVNTVNTSTKNPWSGHQLRRKHWEERPRGLWISGPSQLDLVSLPPSNVCKCECGMHTLQQFKCGLSVLQLRQQLLTKKMCMV